MGFFYNPPPPSQSNSATGNSGTPPYNEVQDGSASQPPFRQVQAALAMAVVLGAWPAQGEPRLQAPNNQQVKIAPLTLAYGDQPPVAGPITPSEYAQVRLTWENPWSAQHAPPLVQPSTGDQPVPQAPLTATELLIRQAWTTDWPAQTGQKCAAWFFPPVVNTPPIVGPLTPTELLIQQSWPTGWAAQGPPRSAATLPQPVAATSQPYVRPFMGRPDAALWRQQTPPATAPLTCQFVGLPAHDSFSVNYAINLGPCNWTNLIGNFETNGVNAFPGVPGQNLSLWKETAFTPHQYAQCLVAAYGGDQPGVCVRISPTGDASYAMVADPSTSTVKLFQTVASVGTVIQTVSSVTLTDGDTLKLQVVGSVLKMFLNGAQIGTDQVDTAVTSGQPGIFVFDAASPSLLDNFLADNLAPPAVDTVLAKPTGWLNAGILAAAFPPLDVQVVETLVSIPDANPDQPQPQGPITSQELTILQSWGTGWPAQSGAKSGAVLARFPACDNFNRADGSLGANWSISHGALQIASNKVITSVADFNLAWWNADTFTANYSSQCTVFYRDDDRGTFNGPAVRVTSGGNGYFAVGTQFGAGNNIELHKYVSSVDTLLTTFTGLTLTNGDLIRLDCVSTTLTVRLNGTIVGSFSDASLSGGQPGIFVFSNVASSAVDDWCADNLQPFGPPGDLVLSKPTGWLNPGIFAAAFQPDIIEVVETFVSIQPYIPDQPSPQAPLSVQNLTVRQAWTTDWPAQTGPKCAAWFVPPVVNTPPPHGALSVTEQVIVQSWPTGWSEPQRLVTLVQPSPGTPPVPRAPLSATATAITVTQWIQTWPSQRGPNNAAWFVPPSIPPVLGPLSPTERLVVQSWPTGWASPPTQSSPHNAAVIPPPPAFNGRPVYLLTYVGDTSVTTFASTNTFVTYAGDASVLTYTTVTNSLLTYPGDTTVTTTVS